MNGKLSNMDDRMMEPIRYTSRRYKKEAGGEMGKLYSKRIMD